MSRDGVQFGGRELPPDFSWEQSFYGGEYRNQYWLYVAGSRHPVACVSTTIHGVWTSTVNRHLEDYSRSRTAKAGSRRQAMRWAEGWALANQERLRRDLAARRG